MNFSFSSFYSLRNQSCIFRSLSYLLRREKRCFSRAIFNHPFESCGGRSQAEKTNGKEQGEKQRSAAVEKQRKQETKQLGIRGRFHRAKQISMPPWPLFVALVERLSALFNSFPSSFHVLLHRDRREYLRAKVLASFLNRPSSSFSSR